MTYTIATDVGGTCTDTVIVDDNGQTYLGKVLSTPPNFADGVIDSVNAAAALLDISLEELLCNTRLFVHGSTVVDNTLLTRSGARTGLVTTRGFEDTLRVTRGAFGRWGGLPEAQLKHPVKTDRPDPLVPITDTIGIDERVDYKGAILEPLDEAKLEAALINIFRGGDFDAVAVSLLWSFKNPIHERKIGEILNRLWPECYISLSSDIAPVPGEYERTSTTVINAYSGKVVRDYLNALQGKLDTNGYQGPLLVMQGHGGLLNANDASQNAVNMIECGPVAGLIGSRFLGERLQQSDVIAVDMGGTTSKVGVIESNNIQIDHQPMVDRFHYTAPKIEVVSIGAGGGSLVHLEPHTNVPVVGPDSAGSIPGPVCYANGGTLPTLTDVMLLIGYMAPDQFLGGKHELDVGKCRRQFEQLIATPMGLDIEVAAAGIFRIACAQMSDLIHQITIERGLDTRDFVLHAFGGTCPMLASTFAEELQVRKIVVPFTASVNCAFGMTTADVVHEFAKNHSIALPCDGGVLIQAFEPLIAEARQVLIDDDFPQEQSAIHCSVAMRYRLQVHELIVPIPSATIADLDLERLIGQFEQQYEKRYGKGSAYKQAGIEITQCRVSAHGLMPKPKLQTAKPKEISVSDAIMSVRKIYAEKSQKFVSANIYDFNKLHFGHIFDGPSVVHTPVTTIVVQENQSASVDEYKNIHIEFLDD